MQKKILVTGGTGFVGSHLLEYLVEHEKTSIIFATKRMNSSLKNLSNIKNKIELLDCDINDFTSVKTTLEKCLPNEIYHLAALSWVTPSWDMPSIYMQTNAIGTINLFEALRFLDLKPRILVSCTPEEFGNVDKKDLPITEETRISPLNPYAASKVAQDMVCMTWSASYNFQIIRTRAFNHEGPRRDILGANASFANQIAKIEFGLQEPIIEVGDLKAVRNFTDVRDIVIAYHLAIKHCLPNELYLIGSDNIYSMQECLEYLISLSKVKGITFKTVKERIRPTELYNFVGDFSKFEKLTSWKPKISFEETMNSVLTYWRKVVELELKQKLI